ncbi:tautomerase family protein, partial [Pseudomonas sp. FH1]|uniref:tautomerase family protein n=1 Tax=Pseudomonas sp. FH1 TaxID=1284392 RepID=UPI0003DD7CB4
SRSAAGSRSILSLMRDRDLVEKLGRATGLNAEDVMVVISTTAGDEWSFGGGRGN